MLITFRLVLVYINWVSRHSPAVACGIGIMPHQATRYIKKHFGKFRNFGPFSYVAAPCTLYILHCLRYFIEHSACVCMCTCTRALVEWGGGVGGDLCCRAGQYKPKDDKMNRKISILNKNIWLRSTNFKLFYQIKGNRINSCNIFGGMGCAATQTGAEQVRVNINVQWFYLALLCTVRRQFSQTRTHQKHSCVRRAREPALFCPSGQVAHLELLSHH